MGTPRFLFAASALIVIVAVDSRSGWERHPLSAGVLPPSLGGGSSWASSGYMRSSALINSDDGFLHEVLAVVDGCEDETGHRPRRSTPFHNTLRVRQVPGDGSCLFHSLTVCLALAQNGSHHEMVMEPLLYHSDRMRQMAVTCFEEEKERVLFLQGDEKMTCAELLEAVNEQYDCKPEEYCSKMRKASEWGGGPEIVVLANLLRRPIHVYELHDGRNSDGSGSEDFKESDLRRAYERIAPRIGVPNFCRVRRSGGSSSISETRSVVTATSGWKLRRIACFGSPRFDRCNTPLHILSADSRFPDLKPGDQLPNGNHFLACFPPAE